MMINRDLLFQIAHDLKRLADAAETFLSVAAAEPESFTATNEPDTIRQPDQTFCDCGEPKDAGSQCCANCERMMRKAEARSQSRTLEDLHNEENTPA